MPETKEDLIRMNGLLRTENADLRLKVARLKAVQEQDCEAMRELDEENKRLTAQGACKWARTEDGQWETDCGHTFEFMHDGPAENRAIYCQYCGRKIEAVKWEGQGDE